MHSFVCWRGIKESENLESENQNTTATSKKSPECCALRHAGGCNAEAQNSILTEGTHSQMSTCKVVCLLLLLHFNFSLHVFPANEIFEYMLGVEKEDRSIAGNK